MFLLGLLSVSGLLCPEVEGGLPLAEDADAGRNTVRYSPAPTAAPPDPPQRGFGKHCRCCDGGGCGCHGNWLFCCVCDCVSDRRLADTSAAAAEAALRRAAPRALHLSMRPASSPVLAWRVSVSLLRELRPLCGRRRVTPPEQAVDECDAGRTSSCGEPSTHRGCDFSRGLPPTSLKLSLFSDFSGKPTFASSTPSPLPLPSAIALDPFVETPAFNCHRDVTAALALPSAAFAFITASFRLRASFSRASTLRSRPRSIFKLPPPALKSCRAPGLHMLRPTPLPLPSEQRDTFSGSITRCSRLATPEQRWLPSPPRSVYVFSEALLVDDDVSGLVGFFELPFPVGGSAGLPTGWVLSPLWLSVCASPLKASGELLRRRDAAAAVSDAVLLGWFVAISQFEVFFASASAAATLAFCCQLALNFCVKRRKGWRGEGQADTWGGRIDAAGKRRKEHSSIVAEVQ